MTSQFFPVGLDAQGAFCAHTGQKKTYFFSGDKRLLTRRTTPAASWPICYVVADDADYLYFTFFLSATIHKWRLTKTFQNESGQNVDRRELIPFFRHNLEDTNIVWLLAKLSPVGLRLQDFPKSPTCEFAALEHAFATAIIESRLRDFLLSTAVDMSFLQSKAAPTYFPSVFRRFNPPLEYRNAVPLSSENSVLIPDVWGYLESDACGFHFGSVLHLLEHVLFVVNNNLSSSLVRISCEVAEQLSDVLTCIVSFDPGENPEYGSGCVKVLRLGISKHLVQSDEPAELFTRLQMSLDLLLPYLLHFMDVDRRKFELRFCFGDRGADGFVSYDRQVGSGQPLSPDLYLLLGLQTKHYFPIYDEQSFEIAFYAKSPILFWRGATTGSFPRNATDFANNPRVRACHLIQRQLGELADCKISSIVQLSAEVELAEEYLRQFGLKGDEVREMDFGLRQFYIDLPGNGAAWGTFRKYLVGCVVLRPMPATRELAYHRILEPGIDFVPVKSDLSDVGDVVRSLIADPKGAAAIAYRGRKKVIEYMRGISDEVLAVIQSAAA